MTLTETLYDRSNIEDDEQKRCHRVLFGDCSILITKLSGQLKQLGFMNVLVQKSASNKFEILLL